MPRNLFNLIVACTALLLVAGCFCRSDRAAGDVPVEDDPASSQRDITSGKRRKNGDGGDFRVELFDVGNSRYKRIDDEIKSEKPLEKAADQLNGALILPHDITLRAKDCGEQNAFYDPRDRSVTMCYELMERFYQTFRVAGDNESVAYGKMFDAVRFVFLHEIGHALIDAYSLPVTGGEEDAADRLSAFVNLRELGDEGVRAVFAAADAFQIEAKFGKTKERNLADEHLLQERRFYNSLCMIYGSNAEKYENIVTDGYLPKERAVRCRNEYQRTVQSWMTLLEPWRKN
ncbi:MAG: DUF4344 domain-containing metallopeptidase [Pyrinomonadaceae bacterium]|nr:DUF4344 domain-containing metallopeptidase [Pyrinomonadaceae bacterium]